MEILDTFRFNADGLIPVVVQDSTSHEVLMLAYMNREAIEKTLNTRLVTYWSRSRQKFWVKGETSGHTQELVSLSLDCDLDTILVKVRQNGPACHENYRSCFFRDLENGKLTVNAVPKISE